MHFNTKMENSNTNEFFAVKRSHSGLGLFAREHFAKGDFLLEYFGELISNEEADRRGGRYLFEINNAETIDGKSRDNLARYLNHACRPNVEAEIDDRQLFFYALTDIEAGEELVFDYGQEYFDEFIAPVGCRCQHCQPS